MPTKFRTRTRGTVRQRGKKFPLLEKKKLPLKIKGPKRGVERSEIPASAGIIRLISYAEKSDAEKEVAESTKLYPDRKFVIVKLKGGEALDRFRHKPDGTVSDYNYIKVPFRYQVREDLYPKVTAETERASEYFARRYPGLFRGGGKVMEEMSGLHYRAGERPYGGKVKPKKRRIEARSQIFREGGHGALYDSGWYVKKVRKAGKRSKK